MELYKLKHFDIPCISHNIITYDTLNNDIIKVKYRRNFYTYFKTDICISVPTIIIDELLPTTNDEKEYFYSNLEKDKSLIKSLKLISEEEIVAEPKEITKDNHTILLNYSTKEYYPLNVGLDLNMYYTSLKRFLIETKHLPKSLMCTTISNEDYEIYLELKKQLDEKKATSSDE